MIPSERTRRIIRTVAEHFDVPVSAILGSDVHKRSYTARHAAVSAVWIETTLSLTQIARHFGKDHTCILNSIRKTGAWPNRDWPNELHGLMDAIHKDLKMSAEAKQIGGNHYKKLGIQPMKFAMVNDWDCDAFQILRYVSRHMNKDGKKDIEKALHCVELRIEQVGMHNQSTTPLLDRISMREYIEANEFKGDTSIALLLLETWAYENIEEAHLALTRVLKRILATYS